MGSTFEISLIPRGTIRSFQLTQRQKGEIASLVELREHFSFSCFAMIKEEGVAQQKEQKVEDVGAKSL